MPAVRDKRALVVLSGGQDSTTCLFEARRLHDDVHCITFDYGQTHACELTCAAIVSHLAGAKSHRVIRLGPILMGKSPLTDRSQKLEQYESFEEMQNVIGDRIEKTFVPMRNALFLSIAANHASCMGCEFIYTGVCEDDNANYPDCHGDFVRAQEACINVALGLEAGGIKIKTPLLHCVKARSVLMACEIGAYHPLAFSHTAYDGQFPPRGKDHASVLRAHGFKNAGLPDPLLMRAVCESAMSEDELPETPNYAHDVWEKHITEYKEWVGGNEVVRAIEAGRDAARRYHLSHNSVHDIIAEKK